MTERYETQKRIRLGIISLLALLFLGYTAYEIQKVITGPEIIILSPENGALLSDSEVIISGKAYHIKEIELNNRKIFIDEDGNFSESLLLSYGYNTFLIRATDKFGREERKLIEVIHK